MIAIAKKNLGEKKKYSLNIGADCYVFLTIL